MPKTCEAFHWILYVILASFIAWGVWFKAIDMNLLDTNPTPKAIHVKKKSAPAAEIKKPVQLPMKPTGTEAKDCKLTRYDGNATVRGWYEQEEVYGKKALVLKVADADRTKLPPKIQTWSDGTPLESIILSNVNAELKKLLIKASAEEPTMVELVSVDVYCEGLPMAMVAEK